MIDTPKWKEGGFESLPIDGPDPDGEKIDSEFLARFPEYREMRREVIDYDIDYDGDDEWLCTATIAVYDGQDKVDTVTVEVSQ